MQPNETAGDDVEEGGVEELLRLLKRAIPWSALIHKSGPMAPLLAHRRAPGRAAIGSNWHRNSNSSQLVAHARNEANSVSTTAEATTDLVGGDLVQRAVSNPRQRQEAARRSSRENIRACFVFGGQTLNEIGVG